MLNDAEELNNTGVFAENFDEFSKPAETGQTFVILGAPRGGTSAIAGALASMGIYMGRGAAAPVFESLALANAIEGGHVETVRELISTFNSEHRTWGFKRPGFTHFVEEYHDFFRNPIYLVILRDPAATANRGMISGRLKANYLKKIRNVLSTYERITSFVESSGAPTLFISYEKLLQDPRQTLNYLCELLQMDVSQEVIDCGANYIEPSPDHYLEVSRAHRIEGKWLELTHSHARGWARYVNKSMDVAPRIILYEGKREIATTAADSVVTLESVDKVSEASNCGFEFDLESLGIKSSSSLRIRARGEIRDMPPPESQVSRTPFQRFRDLLSVPKAGQ